MTDCNQLSFKFKGLKGRPVELDFGGGDISSDGGSVLLAQVDQRLDLLRRASECLRDPRDQCRIKHSQEHMLRQRVFGVALAYEDLNDHDTLRHDPLFRATVGKTTPLASSPTLCRFENRADRQCAFKMNELLVETFIESHDEPPKELILDFDATDDRVHGDQEGRFYHAYYGDYCFLPLYVFCGQQPLVAWLRPSSTDGARGAWLALKLLCARFREVWPDVRIIFRADSGFCRWRMLRWCENNNVDYIIGIAKNSRLKEAAAHLIEQAEMEFEKTRCKVRRFGWIVYGAKKWDRKRFIIAKAEHSAGGPNPRFIITTLKGRADRIYDEGYCARGEMENRIKEQQLGLFADRTSCHAWWPNQMRLLISSLAYTLLETIRRIALRGTEMATAQVTTIRLRLLKVGAIVLTNTRRIRVHMSSAFPFKELFYSVANTLRAPG